ncbi:unnamed protein product [Arabis nemorensis]|uniref:Serine/threonine-protein kinase TOR n=1 Tax=Arabis nemorensis TaxID=586526 RepID=A0A565C1W1_9BRAS|nr:unnamed protein product [Arabis nemorensis]
MSSSFAAGRFTSMSSPSQSHRFCGPAATATGGGSFDTLNRVIADLCNRGNPKEGASLAFRKHVEEAASGNHEMTENASTLFNVHAPEFVDAIWVALRDPQLQVRERAVEALRACLRVIEKRETRWRVQWYYKMFEATQDGLGRNAPVHSISWFLTCCGGAVEHSFFAANTRSASRLHFVGQLELGERRRRLVEEIVEKLLRTAVADADVTVRKSIFVALYGNQCFDDYLAQADSLTAIFASLNYEDFDVREYSISVAGRLSEKNPAYVLPALRCHLIQLLTYLELSADNKCREESAKLLGCLVRNCERLILPYVAPVQKGGLVTRQYIPELMPLIVEALMDGAAVAKREVAVSTLGQVVQSTGYVVTPYQEYPLLLGLLLKLLKGDLVWSTRREVLKVLGIMGALDPHVHKRNQQSLSGSHGEVARGTGDSGQPSPLIDELPVELRPSFATSEDYYSTVAINSLMRILRDASLLSYHKRVLPELFHTVRTSDENLKDFIRWGLGTLVSIERIRLTLCELLANVIFLQHIRKYLPELLSLISELWSSFTLPGPVRPSRGLPVLHLLEHLCLALNDEFRTYLSVILPCTLDEHMHLLLPALIRLFKVDAPVAIRRDAIKTLTRVLPCVQVTTGHISTLVHHLKLVLDGRLPVEVIRDPVIENEIDPFEDGNDRNHQSTDSWRSFTTQHQGRELFAAGFVSCWAQLNEASQKQLVRSLETGFSSPNIPPEILATLLNLAEFMEHDEKPLLNTVHRQSLWNMMRSLFPLIFVSWGLLQKRLCVMYSLVKSDMCRVYGKALHYKEMIFEGARSRMMDANPVAVVENHIHINNQLHQHGAAVGIVTYAQQHLD